MNSRAMDEGSSADTTAAATMEARFADLCKVQALAVEHSPPLLHLQRCHVRRPGTPKSTNISIVATILWLFLHRSTPLSLGTLQRSLKNVHACREASHNWLIQYH
jgi:hypothetical protein